MKVFVCPSEGKTSEAAIIIEVMIKVLNLVIGFCKLMKPMFLFWHKFKIADQEQDECFKSSKVKVAVQMMQQMTEEKCYNTVF